MRCCKACLLTFVTGLVLWLAPTPVLAAVPVFGSPGYTPGVGGYVVGVGLIDGINYSIDVNNSGVAIASGERFNAAGVGTDLRALRWSPDSAEVLGDLGASGGLAFARAHAINDSGDAVGGATIGFGANQAVFWDAGGTTATALPTPVGFLGASLQDLRNHRLITSRFVMPGRVGGRCS